MIFLKQKQVLIWLEGLALTIAIASVNQAPAAESRVFTLSGTNAVLEDVSSEILVLFRALRFNATTGQWNLDLVTTNAGTRQFVPALAVSIEQIVNATGPLPTDGLAGNPPKPFVLLDTRYVRGTFLPGQTSTPRPLALGYLAGQGPPRLTVKVFAQTVSAPTNQVALAITRSLNTVGQPLPGVRVAEAGPSGQRVLATDPDYGVVTLGQGPGDYVWRFNAAGSLPVWRKATLPAGGVLMIPNPRLVARNTNTATVMLTGGLVKDPTGAVQITVPAGVFTQPAVCTITLTDGQTLPGLLPLGWCPLQSFWIESDQPPNQPLSAVLQLASPIGRNDTVILAKWNDLRTEWEAVQIVAGSGTSTVNVTLPSLGAYVLVVPDLGFLAPPAALVGQLLGHSPGILPGSTVLSAQGTVTPATSQASRVAGAVTATATVSITSTGAPPPSGMWFRGEVRETYRLQDGSARFLPAYENFIVGYHRPGNTNPAMVEATFPMRPLLLFGSEELAEAVVRMDVLAPTAFDGAVFETSGGSITVENIRVAAAQGDFGTFQAVLLKPLPTSDFGSLFTSNFTALAAFDLTVSAVSVGHSLSLQVSNLPPNQLFVLARVLSDAGFNGLEPVARLRSGSNGLLESLEPAVEPRLAGLRQAGQYVLLETATPWGLVTGQARNSQGQAVGGLPLRVGGQPWLTFSQPPDGSFRLLAPVGAATLALTDPVSGDTGTLPINLRDPGMPVVANPSTGASGPSVVSVTPANAATLVSLVAAVTVQFNKPVNAGSVLAGGIQLRDGAGHPVPAAVSLDLTGKEASLLPNNPLTGSQTYTIRVSGLITDLQGRPLAAAMTSAFTTVADGSQRLAGAQLISYEPTNGIARVEGTQGFADPNSPVVLVNETTGRTATVLSKPDGSFVSSLEMDVEDRVSALVVNQNGTRNEIPLSRQVFRDGSIGLFAAGGVLQAATPNGPVELNIEPGAIEGKAVIKVEVLSTNQLLSLASNTPPDIGSVVGGFTFRLQGESLRKGAHVGFPVDERQLGLALGESASNRVFALCQPIQVDGVTVYQVVDSMRYENGKVVTHSPPFDGLVGVGGGELVLAIAMWPYLASRQVVITGFCVAAQESDALNVQTNVPLLLLHRDRRLGVVPGAIVTATTGGGGNTKFGLRPGGFVGRASSEGAYELVVGMNPLDPSVVALQAQSPRYANIFASAVAAKELLSPLMTSDLIFHLPNNSSGNLDITPPTVSADPPLTVLPTNTLVTVPLYLTDDLDHPHLVGINMVPSQSVAFPSGALLDPGLVHPPIVPAAVELGPTTTRIDVGFRVDAAALVAYQVTVSDSTGNARDMVIKLRFGAPPAPPTGTIQPADPNDQIRPQVVWSIPSAGGILSPGAPIVVHFSKALHPSVTNGLPVSLTGGLSATVALSADQQTLAITPVGLPAGSTNTLTISGEARDLNNNPLDQDASTTALEPFLLTFRAPPATPVQFSGVFQPAGTVSLGIHHFTLERGNSTTGHASLVVHEGSNPVPITSLFLPSGPRAMALIPSYSFVTNIVEPNTNITTAPLLAVVGGLVGEGNPGPWLRVVNLKHPSAPVVVGGALLSSDSTATASAVKFDPPNLAIMTVLAEGSFIQLINLQALLLGYNWPLTIGPNGPVFIPGTTNNTVIPGVDLNGDGDYVDDNEKPPLPQKFGLFGLLGAYPSPLGRDFTDFDFAGAGGILVATLAAGTNQVAHTNMVSRLQVLQAGGVTVGTGDDAAGAYGLHVGERAFRVLLDPDLPIQDTSGVRSRNAALVCVTSPSASWLDIVDITQPIQPQRINRIPLVTGTPATTFSIKRSAVDEYVIATPTNTLVLRRSLLSLAASATNPSPAIVSVIPATTFTRSIGVSDDYFSFSKDSEVLGVRRPPLVEVVRVPTRPVTNIVSIIARGPEAVANFLGEAQPVGFLPPTYVRPKNPQCSAGLFPADPLTHFYVLLRTSGESGPTLKVAAQSLDIAGRQVWPKSFDYPPVVLTGAGAGVRATASQPAVGSLTAHRLSDQPEDLLYNFYATDAFAVLREPLTDSDWSRLALTPERQVLWSGHFLRVFLDAVQPQPTGLDDMQAAVAHGELVPGVGPQLKSLPGEYIDSPNPSMGASPWYAGVNLQSGEYRFAPTDIRLPGRLQDLVFTRCYESRSEYFGPFGRGWDFNWNARLVEIPEAFEGDMCLTYYGDPLRDLLGRAGDVLLMDGAGTVQLFSKISTNANNMHLLTGLTNDPAITEFGWDDKVADYYASPSGQFSILLKFNDGVFVILAPQGARTYFRADGRLDRLVGVYTASELVCAYREDGRLDRVIGDRGLELEVGYYHDLGAVNTRPYDRVATQSIEEGLISRVRIRYPGGIAGEVSYNYDALGRMSKVQDFSGLEYLYAYDVNDHRLLRRVGRYDGTRFPSEEIVYTNGLVSAITRNGVQTKFTGAADTAVDRYQIVSGAVTAAIGDALPAQFVVDLLGHPTAFANRVVKANDDGRLTRFGDASGQYQLFYDSTNEVYRFRGNLVGTLAEGKPSFTTTNEYDGSAWNRIVRRVNTEGVETTDTYLSPGTPFVSTIEEHTGPVLRTSKFNEFGQMTNEVMEESGHQIVHRITIGPSLLPEGESYGSAPGAAVVSLPGGGAGVQEGGLTVSSTHNADGQPTAVAVDSPDPTVTLPVSSFGFTNGLVNFESFGLGPMSFAANYTFDPASLGRITGAVLQESGLADMAVDFGFDPMGRMLSMTQNDETTQYTHDGILLTGVDGPGLSRKVKFNGTAPTLVTENGVSLSLGYDGEGRLETVTRPESVTQFTYNLGNEVHTKTISDAGDNLLLSETNTYDLAGRLSAVDSPGVTREFDYFADGETRRVKLNGQLIEENERDDAGRLLSTTFPNLVSYHFSDFNSTNGMPERREVRTYLTTDSLPPGSYRAYVEHSRFDGAGRLSQVEWPCGRWSFAYDAFSHLKVKTDPDNVIERWTNSPTGLLLGRGFTDGSGADYVYDANRRLQRAGDQTVVLVGTNKLVAQINEPDGTIVQFGNYNTNFLPERLTYGNVAVINAYKNGLVSAMHGIESIEYFRDGFNRVTNIVRGSITTRLGFDARGQLSREVVANQLAGGATMVWSAVFDEMNHLNSETYPSGLTIYWEPRDNGQLSKADALGIDTIDWQGPDILDTISYSGGLQVVHFLDLSLREYLIAYQTGTNSTDRVGGFQYTLTPGGRILAEQRSHEGRADVFRRNSNLLGMRVTDFLLSAANPTNGAGATVRVEGLAFTDGGEMLSPTNTAGVDDRSIMPPVFLNQGRVTLADGQTVTYNPRGSVETVPVWVRLPGQRNLTRETAALSYDDFGLVKTIVRGAGADQVTVTYVRDGQGRIVQRDVVGAATRCRPGTRLYSWKGLQLIEEYERHAGTNALMRLYAYVGRDLVLIRSAAVPGAPLEDFVPLVSLNGSIGGYLKTDGTIMEMILYGPYGTPVFYVPGAGGFQPSAGSTVAGTLLFQGGWYDEESGLYEFGQRNLHPQLGRFLQRDNDLYVQSRALFAAFNGDPAGMVDPLGASATEAEGNGKKHSALETLMQIRKNSKALRGSAGKGYNALEDALGGTSENPTALSSATVDLAEKSLKFADSFGGEEYHRFTKETLESIGKLKEGVELMSATFEFVEAAGSLMEKHKLLNEIEAMVMKPRGVGLARAWLERSGAAAEKLGFSAEHYATRNTKTYMEAYLGRGKVAASFRDSYREELKEGLFTLGKAGVTLAKFGLTVAYGEKPESRTVQQVQAVLGVLGKVGDAVDAYRDLVKDKAVSEAVVEIFRTPAALKVEGLAEGKALPIGAAVSAIQIGWSVGYEGTQELILAFADPLVAKAYKEASDEFNNNGGWLSVGGGVLATWHLDAAAYRVQRWADWSFSKDLVQPAISSFTTPNPIIDFYMRGAHAP